MDVLLPVALTLLCVSGAAVGVVFAIRGGAAGTAAARRSGGSEEGLLRLTAEVHTGWEQTLIGLNRELRLPRKADEVGYGELYLELQSEHRVLVRSRSEIGRGFTGEIEIQPRRSLTVVTYSILRLPGDDALNEQVLDLELRLITALRRLDANANVNLAASALREFSRGRNRVVDE